MAKTPYDRHYTAKDYFGEPYPALIEFFRSYPFRGTVLDLGCGQGRDALFFARLGYHVIGVDHSAVGIEQLQAEALARSLNITAIVDDLYAYPVDAEIDIVLLDSILHFYQRDVLKESLLVGRILDELRPGALFCNCMLRGDKRERLLQTIVGQSPAIWQTLADTYTTYTEANAEFHMLIIQKGL